MQKHPDEYLTTKQVSAWLKLTPRTLITKRNAGTGPNYVRMGESRIFYRRADVEAWLASRTFKHRAAEATGRCAA